MNTKMKCPKRKFRAILKLRLAFHPSAAMGCGGFGPFYWLQDVSMQKFKGWLIALSPQPQDVDYRRSRAFGAEIRSEFDRFARFSEQT